MLKSYFSFAAFLLLLCATAGAQVALPVQTKPTDTIDFALERASIPGETVGQKLESLLFWSVPEKERRFPHMQDIFPGIGVPAGKHVWELPHGEPLQPNLPNKSFAQYMADNHIGGVIVLKDNKIRLEAYGDGVNRHSVWTSFSVGKSVTSMLLGVALKDGFVENLDDSLGRYIPELAGRDYGRVTVRQLLTMTSGIGWNEDYADHSSDVAQMYLRPCEGSEPHILSYMKDLEAVHKPGKVWNYSTGETDLLGILIQKATGKSLAEYLSETIWKPWGMEQNAFWLADECSGLNLGGSGLSATLRDYARLGLVMLQQGEKRGEGLFADEWLAGATSLLMPTGDDGGYGYLWWRFPNGSYAAFGIFGQMIYVNPATRVVIAQFAAWPQAGSKALSAERAAFIEAAEMELREERGKLRDER